MLARIDYFKTSGKWYHRETVDLPVEHSFELSTKVRELNALGQLPGLANGTWAHIIMVTEVEFDLPYLILP